MVQQRKGTREQLDQNQSEMGGLNTDNVDEDIVVDTLEVEQRDTKDKEFVLPGGQIIGLDQAVLQSIERCRKWSTPLKSNSFLSLALLFYITYISRLANDELRRKMYGCILVVGGGMKFTGIGKWLQNRVGLQIPYLYRSEQLDIVTSPKDMDSDITSWKGGAVMSCLVRRCILVIKLIL